MGNNHCLFDFFVTSDLKQRSPDCQRGCSKALQTRSNRHTAPSVSNESKKLSPIEIYRIMENHFLNGNLNKNRFPFKKGKLILIGDIVEYRFNKKYDPTHPLNQDFENIWSTEEFQSDLKKFICYYYDLHQSAREGHYDIVKILIENNKPANKLNFYNRVPIYYAIRGKHHRVVKLLLEHGANINIITSNAIGYKYTSIDIAIYRGNYHPTIFWDIINAINTTTNISDIDRDKYLEYIILHYSNIVKENFEKFDSIFNIRKKINTVFNSGYTLLTKAASDYPLYGSCNLYLKEHINFLLHIDGIDINVVDNTGKSFVTRLENCAHKFTSPQYNWLRRKNMAYVFSKINLEVFRTRNASRDSSINLLLRVFQCDDLINYIASFI